MAIENILDQYENQKERNFIWEGPFFENPNKTTFNFAEKLVQNDLIKDVYLDKEKNQIIIEFLVYCETDINNIANAINNKNNRDVRLFRIPADFPITGKFGCKSKNEYSCTFYGCPVTLAGYIYHNRYNLGRNIRFKSLEEKLAEEKKELKEKEIVLNDYLKEKYKDLINSISESFYIPDNVKESFYQLIKTLNNYNEISDEYIIMPNVSYAFTDNTDTINQLTSGQLQCIKMLKEILLYFNIINKETKEKIIDFKQLGTSDFFTDDNYEEQIIILKNVYLLTAKDATEIKSERDLQTSITKTKFPSYILKNINKKIFIICDKSINTNLFYSSLNQIKPLFETLDIPELNFQEIHSIFLNKVKNKKYNLKFEEDFDNNLYKYLEINYPYSPYKNLEFIDYIFNDVISKSLMTFKPKELQIDNFPVFRNSKNEDYISLDNLIGLDNVKEEIRKLQNFLDFKNKKEASGEKMPKIDLHMVYLGNPGTGKTTVARLMAGILFNMGYIRYNKCLECESKDLIANITGQTAIKTSEKIQEALGGVLFIDEAYALSESEYGKECIATLIKSMEDYRDDLVVILAGYEVEMNRFLEINSGFKSRIAYTFDFQDYSNEELFQMFESYLSKYGFRIDSNEVRIRFENLCSVAKKSGSSFGNGRFIRSTVDKVLRQHALNVIKLSENSDLDEETIEDIKNHVLLPEDIKLL